MIQEALRFGYEQCASIGYSMGFGAREGLILELALLSVFIVRLYNMKESKK